ncbi:MAG: hypothetical protein PUD02_07305 [Eggerthellales bacterium]|nr:hypothetical protein [Eggerthellales bacterium]
MKGGNVQEFLDTLSLGIEKEFKFRDRTLFAQGGVKDGVWTMTVDQWDPPVEDYIWSTQGETMEQCFNEFLEARIFDGRTFWDTESEMEWVAG